MQRAIDLAPDFAGAHSNLGNALHDLGKEAAAKAALDKALTLAPNDPAIHFNRAMVLRDVGDLDGARDGFRAVLMQRSRHGEAWRMLTSLTRYTSPDDADIKTMERLVSGGAREDRDAMHLHFGLGKALEDAGDTDGAFTHYAKANALYRRSYEYEIGKDGDYFESIKRVFSAEFLFQRSEWGNQSNRPILIVGMMRSGTSLVEQILASHPDVAAGGELKELDRLTRSEKARPDGTEFPGSVQTYDDNLVKSLGGAYVDALVGHVGDAVRITDKMPGNFLYVGLLRLLLPNATVIHCVRDPVDTCLSCYRNYFSGFHPFTYDLAELGRYYRLYRDLMDHWREVVPNYVHDVRYEDLVSDPENQIRQLLDISRLEWDDRCLEFHQTHRPVRTASAAQVRQPMYLSSIETWKKFERHLGPLLKALEGAPGERG